MGDCYNRKILKVDLTTKKIEEMKLEDKVIEEYVGGKGLGVKLVCDNTDPRADSLSENNAMAIMTGPLNPYVPKFVVVSKSPLSNTICTSACGGYFGNELKKAGYDGILITGKADKLSFLKIGKDGASLEQDETLKDKTTSQTTEFFSGYKSLVIGPGGENKVRFASIMSHKRSAGRGGMGAVMGSKNLKAIVVSAKGCKEGYSFPKEFKQRLKAVNKCVRDHPRVEPLAREGTPNLIEPGGLLGYSPVLNYGSASDHKNDSKFSQISGEEFSKDLAKGACSCKPCPISCGKWVMHKGKKTKRPEYESIAMLGPNLGNFDKDKIIALNEICDEMGLDTISTGGVLGFVMALNQKGLFDASHNQELREIAFAKTDNLEDVIHKISHRKGIGNDLADGVKRISEKYGGEDFAIAVKGLECAAYVPDKRTLGQALAYATTTRGGCHMAAPTAVEEITGYVPLKPGNTKARAEIVKWLQDINAGMDCMVMCRFTEYALIGKKLNLPFKVESFSFSNFPKISLGTMDFSAYYKLLSSATGKKYSKRKFLKLGERIINLERDFNLKAGISPSEDTLPKKFLNRLDAEGNGQTILQKMIKHYYKLRGWKK